MPELTSAEEAALRDRLDALTAIIQALSRSRAAGVETLTVPGAAAARAAEPTETEPEQPWMEAGWRPGDLGRMSVDAFIARRDPPPYCAACESRHLWPGTCNPDLIHDHVGEDDE